MNSHKIQQLLPAILVVSLGIMSGCSTDGNPEEDRGVIAANAGIPQSSTLSADSCPAVCTGGCSSENVCAVDCTGTKACEGRTVDCPAGYACQVVCGGIDSCDDVVFNCPAGYPCTVSCEGKDACGDSSLNCNGTAPCAMECGTHNAACEGATVNCSNGPCEATCDGSEAPTMKNCEGSSSCIRCSGGEPPLP